MAEEAPPSPRIRQLAWLVWIALAIAMSLAVLPNPRKNSVTPEYRKAVHNWIAGEPLYNMGGSGFIYMPQAALVFAPWGLLPEHLGEVLWRWTILGLLAAGVFRLTRLASGDDRWFLINSVASAAMAAGCARNGQSTLIITGLMILAAADVGEEHWWRAAILLALAFAFKPVAVVLLLLVAAIHRPMLWRLAICLSVVAVAPYLTQRPDYVTAQLTACFENSRIAFSKGETGYWAQLFGMLKVFGLDLPSPVQQAGRMIAAVATLAACWFSARRLPAARDAFYLYSLAACYLMLFNSRTEGSTYAMVGPVYGLLLAEEWLGRRRTWPTIAYIVAIVTTVFNYDLALLVVKKGEEVWLSPFLCVLVTIDLVRRLIRELSTLNFEPPDPETVYRRLKSHDFGDRGPSGT
ncbi:MAG: DUF2029 domain-containing protein [Planctomycetes bacterium]|nr:DUF2029 domain-containing protein [Planctomycetota bacterium]